MARQRKTIEMLSHDLQMLAYVLPMNGKNQQQAQVPNKTTYIEWCSSALIKNKTLVDR